MNVDQTIIDMLKVVSDEQLDRLITMFRKDKRTEFIAGNMDRAKSYLFMEHACVRIRRDRKASATP